MGRVGEWAARGFFMEEATCKTTEEEAGRQIDHPFSIAFQELGPRGGWRHGLIFWIVALIQCTVCGVKLLPHPPPLQKGEITPQFPGTFGTCYSVAHHTQMQFLETGVGGYHEVFLTVVTVWGDGASTASSL